jgi:aryl-alcohol dehydrogenase-like predicted oxidoreductase
MKNNFLLGLYGLSRFSAETDGYPVNKLEDSIKTLQLAWNNNIRLVDTAPGYGAGGADFLLKSLSETGHDFQVSSKIGLNLETNTFNSNTSELEEEARRIQSFYGERLSSLLLHSPSVEYLNEKKRLADSLLKLKSCLGNNVKLGVSLAKPSHIQYLVTLDLDFSLLVQCNFSWLDWRILPYLKKTSGLHLIARSIFGSGLIPLLENMDVRNQTFHDLFPSSDIRSSWDLEKILSNASEEVTAFYEARQKMKDLTLSQFVLLFYQFFPEIRQIILGPTNPQELSVFIDALSYDPSGIIDKYSTFEALALS